MTVYRAVVIFEEVDDNGAVWLEDHLAYELEKCAAISMSVVSVEEVS